MTLTCIKESHKSQAPKETVLSIKGEPTGTKWRWKKREKERWARMNWKPE